jgi:peptidoglycan/LPS O-acetylase OafA/YrhL
LNKQFHQERNYVASLTGLRGIAALAVFAFHYDNFNPGIRLDLSVPIVGSALQFPLGFGFAGVDLFFVLSGFLLSLPFARSALTQSPHQPIKRYYKRRLLRVFPAYYAQLLIILVTGAWFVSWRSLEGTSLLAHLVMFFNIGLDPVRPLVGVWWTLPIELSFYLMLPLIASFLRPWRWIVFLLLCISLSILYRTWSASQLGAVTAEGVVLLANHIPGSLPEFLMGASAAMVVQWFDVNSIKKPPVWVLDLMLATGATLAIMWLWNVLYPNVSTYWQGHWSMIIAPVAFGFPLSLMVISLYWGSRIGRLIFANPVIYYLGLISYSLYLWHFIVLQQLEVILGDANETLQGFPRFLISLLLVVLVSSVSYFAFERPFFHLNNQRSSKKQL